MEKLSEAKMGLIEKVTGLPYFLFLLSVVLFSDTYLLAVYGITLRHIDEKWLNSHNSIGEITGFIGAFGFFYAAFVPGAIFFFNLVSVFLTTSKFPATKNGWVHIDKIKDYAIANNNDVAYKEYKKLLNQIKEVKHIDSICFSLVFLCVVGWFSSKGSNYALFQFLYFGIESFPLYIKWPLYIATIPFVFLVLMVAFRITREYDQYTYLPEFEKWSRVEKI